MANENEIKFQNDKKKRYQKKSISHALSDVDRFQ